MDSPRTRGFVLALTALALVATAPASASFPGKNGVITYTTSRGYSDGSTSIWAQSPFGGAPRELLPHDDSAERPDVTAISDEDASWAPSGKRFVFARRTGGGNLRLFVTEAGMTSARAIPLPEDMYARSPAFAPDGRTVVFVEVISGGDPAVEVTWEADQVIWTVRTDGTGLRRLGRGDKPAWSPRGGLIAFLGDEGLATMRPDGSRRRAVLRMNPGFTPNVATPDFAPNGRRIAYVEYRDRGDSYVAEIFTVGIDGRGRRRVATGPNHGAREPAWSPDGGSIAFHRDGGRGATSGLYRVPAGGGRQTRIAGDYTPDLAWQPRR